MILSRRKREMANIKGSNNKITRTDIDINSRAFLRLKTLAHSVLYSIDPATWPHLQKAQIHARPVFDAQKRSRESALESRTLYSHTGFIVEVYRRLGEESVRMSPMGRGIAEEALVLLRKRLSDLNFIFSLFSYCPDSNYSKLKFIYQLKCSTSSFNISCFLFLYTLYFKIGKSKGSKA
ncbi:unnamed protein product [Lactuca saligna]|uniref:Uncharacterized protein n=1 Tax=Lactuca saligna TaxID=75948 RepID=A0AA36A2G0_LACSI|nr:unnamed protein product [Lactuca saligna]